MDTSEEADSPNTSPKNRFEKLPKGEKNLFGIQDEESDDDEPNNEREFENILKE